MHTQTDSFPPLPSEGVAGGDMPGDRVLIQQQHVQKAQALFHPLMDLLRPRLDLGLRTVVSVHGGSGVGKSEVGALLGHYLNAAGLGTRVISGDNYPRRIPSDNDHQRLLTFREAAVKSLVAAGEYSPQRHDLIRAWQEAGQDADPSLVREQPWMAVYQRGGRRGLEEYLGSPEEIDFDELNCILAGFHAGASSLWLKRMGRRASELWYDRVECCGTRILLLEWTHGNSRHLKGVNVPILLHSTPEETLEHRRKRARDGAVDSPFTTLVLQVEHQQIQAQAHAAALVIKNDLSLEQP